MLDKYGSIGIARFFRMIGAKEFSNSKLSNIKNNCWQYNRTRHIEQN